MITVYSYAIEILTTNRTDSLQYTALTAAAYKAYPPNGGLELATSRSLCQMLFNALSGPLTRVKVGLERLRQSVPASRTHDSETPRLVRRSTHPRDNQVTVG